MNKKEFISKIITMESPKMERSYDEDYELDNVYWHIFDFN
jgi:hypothetical protein